MAKSSPNKSKPGGPPVATPVPAQDALPTISLNLSAFHPITSGKFCELGRAASIPPNPPTPAYPQMSVIFDDSQSIDLYPASVGNGAPNGGLKVKKQAKLSFTITPISTSLQGPYVFAGLTLVPLTGAPTDANFSKARWTPSLLEFKVAHGTSGGQWKLYVSILDCTTATPVLGLIDPEIENDVPALDPKD